MVIVVQDNLLIAYVTVYSIIRKKEPLYFLQ